mgnify:CR=1 FL=1
MVLVPTSGTESYELRRDCPQRCAGSLNVGALICTTVLLCVAGWSIGRGGRLSTGERVTSTLVAGMFGLLFILLKTFLH